MSLLCLKFSALLSLPYQTGELGYLVIGGEPFDVAYAGKDAGGIDWPNALRQKAED